MRNDRTRVTHLLSAGSKLAGHTAARLPSRNLPMALFWKRKQDTYISLGLNREATEEEKKIAERRHEGPEPDIVDKLKEAVTATRETCRKASRRSSASSGRSMRTCSTSWKRR